MLLPLQGAKQSLTPLGRCFDIRKIPLFASKFVRKSHQGPGLPWVAFMASTALSSCHGISAL